MIKVVPFVVISPFFRPRNSRIHFIFQYSISFARMMLSVAVLSSFVAALTVHAEMTATTLQPVFELPLDGTSTVYKTTVTSTSAVDCKGSSLVVSTFRAVTATGVWYGTQPPLFPFGESHSRCVAISLINVNERYPQPQQPLPPNPSPPLLPSSALPTPQPTTKPHQQPRPPSPTLQPHPPPPS